MSVFRQVNNKNGVDIRMSFLDSVEWRIVEEEMPAGSRTDEYPYRVIKGDIRGNTTHIFTVGKYQVLQIMPLEEKFDGGAER